MGKTNWERATTVFWRWYNTMGLVIPDSRKAELILGIERALNKADARKYSEPGYVLGIDTEHAEDYGTEAVFKNGIGVVSGFFKVPASVVNGHISSESESKCTVKQPEPQRRTREEALVLADRLLTSNPGEETTAAFKDVVSAITGQPKPAPEFDAEKIKGDFMRMDSAVCHILEFVRKPYVGTAELHFKNYESGGRKILTALGIE